MSLFLSGGIFSMLILVAGIAAIAVAALQLARRNVNLTPLIVGLTAVTFLLAVIGYGVGMHEATQIVDLDKPIEAAATMSVAQGIASSVLAVGGLFAMLSTVLGTLGVFARRLARP